MKRVEIRIDNTRIFAFEIGNESEKKFVDGMVTIIGSLGYTDEAQLKNMVFTEFVNKVCKEFGIGFKDFFSGSRKLEYSDARKVVAASWRRTTGEPWVKLSKRMQRDHSSVMTMVSRLDELMCVDHQLKMRYGIALGTLKNLMEAKA